MMLPGKTASRLVVLALLAPHLAFTAGKGSHSVAIMSVDAGASSVVVDQLTAVMSRDPLIRLVEREAITRVMQEQELGALGTASSRVKLGQLIGAEVLVLVAHNPVAGTNAVRILICDSATGARIGQIYAVAHASGPVTLAGEIRDVLARFREGVQSVVAVPDLISRDLRLEHAGLQTALAELLRAALSREQGMALLELEEAKSIAGEHALTGGEVRRIVPLYVEGEYRTDLQATNGPQISITATLRMAQRDDLQVASGRIPLNDGGKFVAGTVRAKVLEFLKRPGSAGFDSAQEFARLVSRADQFAEIGDFDRAAAVREAALLLQPQANEQRIRLVRNYVSAGQQSFDNGLKPGDRKAMALWAQVVSHRREAWRRSLHHVEYLIRNRCVDINLGTDLFDQSIRSTSRVRGPDAVREEELKKEFLRHMAPALLKLPGKRGPTGTVDERSSAAYRIYDGVFLRMDGNYLAEDDLELAGDLLCELLPEDTPLAMSMLYTLRSGTQTYGRPGLDVSPEAWMKFVQRLMDSPRPLVNAYGRYAKLNDQHIRLKQATETMLAEARALAAVAQKPPIKQLDPRGELSQAASRNAVWIEMDLGLRKPPAIAPSTPREKGPVLQPDGSLLCERVRLRPLNPTITPAPAATSPNSRRPEPAVSWQGLLRVWEGADVAYSATSVVLLSRGVPGREIFSDKRGIGDAVFDGRYLWMSIGLDRSVQAIDNDGRKVASVSVPEGLPEANHTRPLLPLGPGRVMAAGSIKQTWRGWLATIEIGEGKPRVNVFHEAIKVPTFSEDPKKPNLDATVGFQPSWIMEHRDQTGKRWGFVGRNNNHQPLVVDLDTLAVSVYPAGPYDPQCFPRNDPGSGVFLSRDGLLYIAGSNRDFRVYRFDPQSRRLSRASDRVDDQWHYGNATQGCLAEYDGYIYYAGTARWLRRSVAGGSEEVLVVSPRSLPHYGSGGGWQLGVSNIAGLVAWFRGQLYQVAVEPRETAQTSP